MAQAAGWASGQWLETTALPYLAVPEPSQLLVSVVLGGLLVLVGAAHFLGLLERFVRPRVFDNGSHFSRAVVDLCPVLSQSYVPVWLWGRNKHLQSLMFGMVDRWFDEKLESTTHSIIAEDGAVSTYAIFQRETDVRLSAVGAENNPVILVVPGIGNNSCSKYIQCFANSLLAKVPHCRVAVLNHLGTDENTKLAVPRVFSYGCTLEFAAMVDNICCHYPHAPLVAVGFSMGGNIVLNYFGKFPCKQELFVAVVSCCQGYDIVKAEQYFNTGITRVYNFYIARNVRNMLTRLRSQLFGRLRVCSQAAHNRAVPCTSTSLLCQHKQSQPAPKLYSSIPLPDEQQVLLANNLQTLDEYFFRRVGHFDSVQDFYRASSSANYINKITRMPVLFLNAEDDPLVSPEMLSYPKKHAEQHPYSLYVQTRHGSHLGFYEGGLLIPNAETWMDRFLVQYIQAVLSLRNDKPVMSHSA